MRHERRKPPAGLRRLSNVRSTTKQNDTEIALSARPHQCAVLSIGIALLGAELAGIGECR